MSLWVLAGSGKRKTIQSKKSNLKIRPKIHERDELENYDFLESQINKLKSFLKKWSNPGTITTS